MARILDTRVVCLAAAFLFCRGVDAVFPTEEATPSSPTEVSELPISGGDGSTAERNQPRPGDVEFHLFTRLNPLNAQVLTVNSTSNETSLPLDLSSSLIVIIHGFTGTVTSKSVTLIRDAVLYAHNVNVLAVQWARLARGPWYDEAVDHTLRVSRQLAALLLGLEADGLNLDNVHIVGFSLGAHVAGFTGALLDGRVGRITGLDPARPGFDNRNETGRLDASDARFVVGLHTGSGFVAMPDPVGHVDFYPNGGSKQPHCQTEDLPLVCNHFMAYIYFAESLYEPKAFPAYRCISWDDYVEGLCDANEMVFMSYDTPNTTRGRFYLRTNKEEPYGLGLGRKISGVETTSKTVPEAQDSGTVIPTPGGGGQDEDIYVVDNGVDKNNSVEVHTRDHDLWASREAKSISGGFVGRPSGALFVFSILVALFADILC